MTGHAFRGLASTILHESGFDEAHIELQLAHLKRNKVAAAYNHAKYLKQRTAMMQWWADYLDAQLAKGRPAYAYLRESVRGSGRTGRGIILPPAGTRTDREARIRLAAH